MKIELTPAAAEEIRQLLREQGPDAQVLGLRVGVSGVGTRRRFTLELNEPDAEHPNVTESQGIRIHCGEADAAQLDGVTIGFQDAGGGVRGFVFKLPSREAGAPGGPADGNPSSPREQRVRDALREVIDPEVGINIVDLGLVYGVAVSGRGARVILTMTTPACPLGEQIKRDVSARVRQQCPDLDRVDVEIVWEPPWGPQKMSDRAKELLGWSR